MANRIWLFLGPSATGKTTLVEELTRLGRLHKIVSITTRAPRPGEKHGDSYIFISRTEFEGLLKEKSLAEHTEFDGNYYGILRGDIDARLAKGHVGIVVEPNGAKQFQELYGDSVRTVYIYPPSTKELKDRIQKRNPDMTDHQVLARLEADKAIHEFEKYSDYALMPGTMDDWIETIGRIMEYDTDATA